MVEGAGLENRYTINFVSRVRIPPPPQPEKHLCFSCGGERCKFLCIAGGFERRSHVHTTVCTGEPGQEVLGEWSGSGTNLET